MTLEIWVSLSRYCIERVFRPRKLDRFHPKELLECAFDIVTSTTNSFLPTAEIIYTIYEIIQEFPALQVPFHILTFQDSPLYFFTKCGGENHSYRPASQSVLQMNHIFTKVTEKSLLVLLLRFSSGSYLHRNWFCFWGWVFSAHSSKIQDIRLRFLRCS